MKKSVLLLLAIFMAMTSFAQSAITHRNTITPGAGETWWGYFTDDDLNADNFGPFGVNSKVNYEAAIRIQSNDLVMGGATIKAVRLWLNATTLPKITSLKIWVSKTLKINAQGVAYVQDVDLSTLTEGANDIEFTTPYVVNNSNAYIGFTMELNAQDYALMCGGEHETNSFWARATAEMTNWRQVTDHGKLALQVLAEGVNIPQNCAMTVTKNFGTHYYQKGDEAVLPLTIKNKGQVPISSVSYIITTNNDASTATPEVTVSLNNVAFNEEATFNVSFDTSVASECTKTVTITKVNGEPNEALAKDVTASGTFVIREFLIQRVPVVEEYTGTWCGWCPRGFTAMDMAHDAYGDKVVLIAAHNGDPMEIADYNPVMASSFPTAKLNRKQDVNAHPATLPAAIEESFTDFPDGKVDITAKWNDEERTKIDIQVNSIFALAKNDANYGIALVLTNDGLRGSGSSWAQANYYNTTHDAYLDEYWYGKGQYISGLTFNHVAVAAWNIKSGFDGSVPTSFVAGEQLPFNYLADITGKTVIQNKDQLHAIALLIDRSNNQIVNAAQTDILPYGTVTPGEYYLVGSFNSWNTDEEGGRLAFTETEEAGVYQVEGALEAGAEFKIITPNGDGWTWYGGIDELGGGYFLINNELLNTPLQLVDGSNFRMENGGEFTFCINVNDMTLTVIPKGGPAVAGDVNGDGFVTSADVTAIYDVLLGTDMTFEATADVNGDGYVTSADVTAVYDILLGNNVEQFDNVYILGEVNGNQWGAATGVKMTTSDGKIYTAEITITSSVLKGYFGFTKALASADDLWDDIADKRFGPHTESDMYNFVINDEVLGQEIPLFTTDWKALEAEVGKTYHVTINLEAMTLVINMLDITE